MELLNHHIAKDGFRLRGTAMSRVDGFSDVVFGFALTLLVVSLEVPKTYAELHVVVRGFFPFAICFVFLMTIWMEHYRFFRRYGLEDTGTILLNAVLLFLVLFYVYPMKFLFAAVVASQGSTAVFSNPGQIRGLMELYGLGYAAIYAALGMLYLRAWKLRDALSLTAEERFMTRTDMADQLLTGCVGILSALTALLLPAEQAGSAGFVFFLIALVKHLTGRHRRRRLQAMQLISLTSGDGGTEALS